MGKLDGRVAVITGAGSGQGAAAARLFTSEGAAVVVADVNPETGKQVTEELTMAGAQAAFALCDVSDAAQVQAAIGVATRQFGRLDVLYNNAGLWFSAQGNYRPGVTDAPSPLLEENIWDRTLNVNLKGTYLGCKYAIPEMQKVGGGSIINVSSIAALRVGSGASDAYTAAKGGVVTMTRTLAVEHAKYQNPLQLHLPRGHQDAAGRPVHPGVRGGRGESRSAGALGPAGGRRQDGLVPRVR